MSASAAFERNQPIDRRGGLRVAYVSADPGVPVFGAKGCSVHVQEVLRVLARHGAKIDLFSSRLGGEAPADLQGVRTHAITLPPSNDLISREHHQLAQNHALRRALERLGPLDLVYERYSLFSYGAMAWARRQGVPAILEVNAPLIDEQQQHRDLHHLREAQWVAARALAGATAVVAVSTGVARYLERFPEAHGKVTVLPNGVDVQRFRSPQAMRKPPVGNRPRPFTIGFVGSLKPWHGVDRLLAAFEVLAVRRPQSRLLIVGDGPERRRLEHLLAEQSYRRAVTFTGAVAPERIPALLAEMDVAVAPYPPLDDFYFSPLKIVEYMAAGLPVVASAQGDIPTVIEHGENGLLLPADDDRTLIDALTAALERLHDDPELRWKLGSAAQQRAAEHHDWSAVVARALQLVGLSLEPKAAPDRQAPPEDHDG